MSTYTQDRRDRDRVTPWTVCCGIWLFVLTFGITAALLWVGWLLLAVWLAAQKH